MSKIEHYKKVLALSECSIKANRYGDVYAIRPNGKELPNNEMPFHDFFHEFFYQNYELINVLFKKYIDEKLKTVKQEAMQEAEDIFLLDKK